MNRPASSGQAARWEAIERLFTRALDLPPERRDEFLAAACSDDEQRREVRKLLAAHDAVTARGVTGERFLEQLDAARAAALIEPSGVTDLLERLQRALGSTYRVERELGGGGMSRIFVAEQLELGRRIVVKVLSPDLAGSVSIERFQREIRLAARLQHPHIVPLLSAGRADELLYYTMPLVEGEPLSAKLAREGALPIDECVRILQGVVDALAYAHGHGVVHRDIKPDNVLLEGRHALLTDFGVAKALTEAAVGPSLTGTGFALGTPAYMSPEQAAADPHVDHRADIYSVGVLAYELLTGRPPFGGVTPHQLIAAHINERPEPITKHRPEVPSALAEIVMRCLEKNPPDRWQDAEELLRRLEAIGTSLSEGARSVGGVLGTGRRPLAGLIAIGAAAALLAVAMWVLPRTPTAAAGGTTRITNLPGLEVDPAISPDGKFIAYAAGPIGHMRIFVRQLAGGRTVGLTDSLPGNHRAPRWSADGTRVSFLADDGLYVIPALGGSPARIFDLPHYQASDADYLPSPAISRDGKWIAYATPTAIYAQALDAGRPIRLAQARLPHGPVWSPDGRKVAYVSDNPWFIYGTLSLGNIAPSAIWVADVECARRQRRCPSPIQLTSGQHLSTSPVWAPDGRALLFVSDAGGYRDIYEQRLTSGGTQDGPALRLTTGLNAHSISLSADGASVAYSSLTSRSNIWSAPISPTAPTPLSAAVPITNENQSVEGVAVSPDGRWLAYDSNRGGRQHIFKMPLSGGEPIQLTQDSTDNLLPQWSPDAREIAYQSLRGGNRDLVTMTAYGRNQRRATSLPGHEFIPDWSPDGRQLVFISDLSGRLELHVIARRPDGTWSPPRQITSGGVAYGPRWSPDGFFIAYSATDTTIRIVSPNGGVSRVALDGRPRRYSRLQADWGHDPATLFCHVVDRESRHEFWAIPLRGGTPRLVLRFDDLARQPRRTDFATDGERLYFTVASDESDVYVMELKRR